MRGISTVCCLKPQAHADVVSGILSSVDVGVCFPQQCFYRSSMTVDIIMNPDSVFGRKRFMGCYGATPEADTLDSATL